MMPVWISMAMLNKLIHGRNKMTPQEIFDILKECAGFKLKKTKDDVHGFGAINRCPECKGMSRDYYHNVYYPNMTKKLESLPWTAIVKDPRSPKNGEYPTDDGIYITMMDCNEHEVCTNTFRNGHFTWMDRTHIKWWMPLPNIK